MKIFDRIYMLKIPASPNGMAGEINLTLLKDGERFILVDSGFPGQAALIRAAVEQEGVPFASIDTVILTHQDIDHVGSLLSIQREGPGALEVLAHEEEKAYIEGTKLPVKVARLQSQEDSLPEKMKAMYTTLKNFFAHNPIVVNRTLSDGEELPYCGGITVVHTPGHTPGHICLYLKHYQTLIAGDALRINDGVLGPMTESSNHDLVLYRQSLQKLLQYEIETVICYHGGLFTGDINKRIAEIIGK